MARVVIEIDGDSSGAEEALGVTKDAVEDLGNATDATTGSVGSMDQSVGGLNTRLVNFTAGANLFSMGVQSIRGGIDALWESTERYFTATEEGEEQWEAIERQGRELKGLLFELFIGTSDQNEAFERMTAIMGDLVSVGRGVIGVVTPFIDLVRGGVSTVRNFALAIGGVDANARDAARGLDSMSGSTEDAMARVQAFRDLFTAPSGVETINDLAEDLSEELGPELARAFEQVSGEMFAALMETNAAREGFLGVGDAVGAFHQEISRAADLKPEIRALLRDMTDDEEGRALVWNVGAQAMIEWQNIASDTGDTIDDLGDSSGDAAEQLERLKLATEALSASADKARGIMKGEEEDVRRLQLLKQMSLEFDMMRAAEQEKALTTAMILKDEAAKQEEADLLRMDALKDALDEKEATRAAKQAERVNIAKGGFQALTNSAIGMMTQQVKSGKKSRDEMRKFIGDELVAYGAMGLAKAAMMIFEPGKQALAIGLGIASAAAIGLGAKMGSSASAGGAPAAPASTAQPATVTNVTFQNNFAQIGSREAFLRVTGDTFQQAVDEGYIAIPRG